MTRRAVQSKPLFASLLSLLSVVAIAGASSPAAAQEACPPGNLLAGKLPVGFQDLRRELRLLTDNQVANEGAVWDAATAVLFDTGASTVTFDLGRPTPVQALHMQGDANDTYTVWGSDDGQTFRVLGRVEIAEGVHGLRSRQMSVGGATVRFLRVGEGVGDNFYSISEIQAFCSLPSPWPPQLQVITAPTAVGKDGPWWNDTRSRQWEFWLALAGAWLLHWGWSLERRDRPNYKRRLRDRLLALMGVLAAFTYVNFGSFHFGNFVHGWDTFHYYAGAKYFREMSYDRLYECVAVADAESGLRRRVELRKMTNLRTNALVTSAEILEHPEMCKKHFSAARWEAFKKDIAYFRGRENAKRWDDTSTDHGYNATPVWNIAGSLLANTGPASETQIFLLTLLDPAYYVGMILVVWWAFGWRTLAVGLLAFATFFPSRFYWTGGAFLRWDWLFYTVASVCCLKKGKPLLAGLAIGYATLLRIFPGFLGVGPVVAALVTIVRLRKAEKAAPGSASSEGTLQSALRPYLQYFAGAAIAAVVLVPISIVIAGSADSYRLFINNSRKHLETPLTNNMGAKTVLAYRPAKVGRLMRNDKLTDPWKGWKDGRVDAYKQLRPLHWLLMLGTLGLIAVAVSTHRETWMAAAFGALFIPIATELTCYYYAFIIVPALLWEKRREVGWLLLGLTAFSEIASFGHDLGFNFLPGWLDEQYTLISAATIGVFGIILYWFTPWGVPKPYVEVDDDEDEEEEEAASEEEGDSAAGKAGRKGRRSGPGGRAKRVDA